MKQEYKRFTFILTSMAPIHIGSGQKFTSREFLYQEREGIQFYYFPDMGKLYHHLVELGLDRQFDDFLLEKRNQGKRLGDFLEYHQVQVKDFGGYSIKATGLEHASETAGKLNDVSSFVRDGFGQPYIPGSSLKGAIRTILLNTHWKYKTFADRDKERRGVIPWGAKKNKDFDDIFNEIRVRDSQPFSNEDLMIVQKWDYSVDKKAAKPLPLFRESLSPLRSVEFEIVTTTKRAYELIKNLPAYAKKWYGEYSDFYLSEPSRRGNTLPSTLIQQNLQAPIYLGAGSGVWTKTIMREAEKPIQRKYAKGKTRMVGKGVFKLTKAPTAFYRVEDGKRSLLQNKDSYYEMGKACFKLEEVCRY